MDSTFNIDESLCLSINDGSLDGNEINETMDEDVINETVVDTELFEMESKDDYLNPVNNVFQVMSPIPESLEDEEVEFSKTKGKDKKGDVGDHTKNGIKKDENENSNVNGEKNVKKATKKGSETIEDLVASKKAAKAKTDNAAGKKLQGAIPNDGEKITKRPRRAQEKNGEKDLEELDEERAQIEAENNKIKDKKVKNIPQKMTKRNKKNVDEDQDDQTESKNSDVASEEEQGRALHEDLDDKNVRATSGNKVRKPRRGQETENVDDESDKKKPKKGMKNPFDDVDKEDEKVINEAEIPAKKFIKQTKKIQGKNGIESEQLEKLNGKKHTKHDAEDINDQAINDVLETEVPEKTTRQKRKAIGKKDVESEQLEKFDDKKHTKRVAEDIDDQAINDVETEIPEKTTRQKRKAIGKKDVESEQLEKFDDKKHTKRDAEDIDDQAINDVETEVPEKTTRQKRKAQGKNDAESEQLKKLNDKKHTKHDAEDIDDQAISDVVETQKTTRQRRGQEKKKDLEEPKKLDEKKNPNKEVEEDKTTGRKKRGVEKKKVEQEPEDSDEKKSKTRRVQAKKNIEPEVPVEDLDEKISQTEDDQKPKKAAAIKEKKAPIRKIKEPSKGKGDIEESHLDQPKVKALKNKKNTEDDQKPKVAVVAKEKKAPVRKDKEPSKGKADIEESQPDKAKKMLKNETKKMAGTGTLTAEKQPTKKAPAKKVTKEPSEPAGMTLRTRNKVVL